MDYNFSGSCAWLVLILNIVEVKELCKYYHRGKIKAVNNASFSVEEGETFGLIGPNGAGKTTIFSCLLALTHPSSGTLSIAGKSPFNLDVKPLIGVLPERPNYNRWMTIEQFLAFHHWLSEGVSNERNSAIKNVLRLVELDVDVKRTKIRELSRGMLQRIGFAQALIGRPRICFLDEPTSGMDPLGFILIRKLLLKCKEDGITVVLNSHHLQEVERVCDRIAFIRKGIIQEVSRVADLSQIRQTLVLNWVPTNLNKQAILQDIENKSGCKLIDTVDNTGRFVVPDIDTAAEIISLLGQNGLRVWSSNFEKRELVELFLNNPESDQSEIE